MFIVLLIERLFIRNCLFDCFDRFHTEHEKIAFGSLDEWRAAPDKKNLKPAVVIYFLRTGLGFAMKREFERLVAFVPNVPIVVLSDTASFDEIMRFICYAARGYIPTSMPYHLPVQLDALNAARPSARNERLPEGQSVGTHRTPEERQLSL